jgi:transcriptional regulator with XRE-family HTH domain
MIGERLRVLRQLEGITVPEMKRRADELEIRFCRSTYSNYERAKMLPSLEAFERLAMIFGIELRDFFAPELSPAILDTFVFEVARNLKNLSGSDRAQILQIVKEQGGHV